jgi:hypothetical protein
MVSPWVLYPQGMDSCQDVGDQVIPVSGGVAIT